MHQALYLSLFLGIALITKFLVGKLVTQDSEIFAVELERIHREKKRVLERREEREEALVETLIAEGRKALRERRYDNAEQIFESILEKDGENFTALTYVAEVYMKQNNPLEAITMLNKAHKVDPLEPGILITLGNLYRSNRDFELAQDALTHALAIHEPDADAHYSLALVYIELNKVRKARNELRRTLELEPGYTLAQTELNRIKSDKARQNG